MFSQLSWIEHRPPKAGLSVVRIHSGTPIIQKDDFTQSSFQFNIVLFISFSLFILQITNLSAFFKVESFTLCTKLFGTLIHKWREDWNDESVYDEQPFGTKIGDSAPFNKIVDAITKDVLTQLSGDAFKKKVK